MYLHMVPGTRSNVFIEGFSSVSSVSIPYPPLLPLPPLSLSLSLFLCAHERRKATITFLKSGEYQERDETTVVARPPMSQEEEEERQTKRRAVQCLCLVALATGLAVAGVVVKWGVGGGGYGRK